MKTLLFVKYVRNAILVSSLALVAGCNSGASTQQPQQVQAPFKDSTAVAASHFSTPGSSASPSPSPSGETGVLGTPAPGSQAGKQDGGVIIRNPTVVSLAITPSSVSIAKGLSQQFQVTATLSDGTTANMTPNVAWGTQNASVASNSGGGLFRGMSQGSANITASMAGVSAPTAVLTVTAPVLTSLVISPASAAIPKGQSQSYTVVGTFSDGTTQSGVAVEWISSQVSVATISTAGVALGVGAGSTSITAKSGTLVSSPAGLSVIGPQLVSVAVNPASASVAKGSTKSFSAIGTYSDGSSKDVSSTATWSSSSPSVSINSSGVALGVSVGSANLTARVENINSTPGVLTVTDAQLVSLVVSPATASVVKGLSKQFSVMGSFTDGSSKDVSASATWSSSNTSASINASGLALGLAVGSANIVARVDAISSAPAQLTVTEAQLVSLAVSPSSASIAKGFSQQFSVMGTMSDGSNKDFSGSATWNSSSSNVVIDALGLALGSAVGSSNIVAKVDAVSSAPAQLTVTEAQLVSLAVSPSSASIAKGLSKQFSAMGTMSDGSNKDFSGSAIWSTSNATASIDALGLAQGNAVGSANIVARVDAISSAPAQLTITAAQLVSLAVSPSSASIAKGLSQQFSVMGTMTDGSNKDFSGSAIWSSSSAAASIGASGLAQGNAVGSANILAKVDAISSAPAQLNVSEAQLVSLIVSPSSASIAKGLSKQFSVMGTMTDGSNKDFSGSATWSSSSAAASIDASGLALGNAVGSANLVARVDAIASGAAQLDVTAAELVSLAVSPSAASVAKGLSQQFTVMGTMTDGTNKDFSGSATWSSSNANASINASGLAMGNAVGSANLIARVAAISSAPAVLDISAAQLVSLVINPSSASIVKGLSKQFSVMGTLTDGSSKDYSGSASWSASNANVSVDGSGLAFGNAVGSASLSASAESIVSSPALVNVSAPELVSLVVNPASASVAKGLSQQFSVMGTLTDGSSKDYSNNASWSASNAAVAAINGSGYALSVGQGSSDIVARVGAIASAPAIFNVTEAQLLSLAINPSSASAAKGLSQNFSAIGTLTDNSTKDYTASGDWSALNPSIASVDKGIAMALAEGSTRVIVKVGDVSSSPAIFNVTEPRLVSLAVSPSSASVAKGLSQQFNVSGTLTDGSSKDFSGSATWSASNAMVSVNSSGLARAIAQGNANVIATVGDISAFAVMTVTEAKLVSLAISPASASVAKGLSKQFSVAGTMTDDSTRDFSASAMWMSSNAAVASVNAGLANGLTVGSSSLTAKVGDIVSGSAQFAVTEPRLLSLAITPSSASIAKGLTKQFSVEGTLSDGSKKDFSGSALWVSSSAAATISTSGLAFGADRGTANLVASVDAISSPAAVLTVTEAKLISLAVSPSSSSISKGLSQAFKAVGTWTDGGTRDWTSYVTWSSSSADVASINASGIASGLKEGSSVISAKAGTVVSNQASLVVSAPALVSLEVTPATASIAKGRTQQYRAMGRMTDGSSQDFSALVTWTSSAPTVAYMTNLGLAFGNAEGNAVITASSAGVSPASASLVVTAPALVSLALSPLAPSVISGRDIAFTATGTYSDTSTNDLSALATWSSATPSVATISSLGLASGLAQGTSVIRVSYGGFSRDTTLTVTAPVLVSLSLQPPTASVIVGLTQQFTASGVYSDGSVKPVSATWSSSNTAKATVSSSGLATGLVVGSALISASSGSIVGNAGLQVTAPILLSLAVSPSSVSVLAGGTQQFTVVGTLSNNTTKDYTASATWVSANNSVASMSGAGLATAGASGSTTIVAQAGGITSNAATFAIASLSLANLHNNSVLQTGFVVGSSTGVASVGVQLDGGDIQAASGTASWKYALPKGSKTWRLGSRHTIKVGKLFNGALVEPTVSIRVVKMTNQDVNGDGYPDIAAGDSSYNNYDGRAYVFLSQGATGISVNSAAKADTIISGVTNEEGELGNAVAMDDFNGDGYADLAVGSDSYIACIRCSVGKVYVFLSRGTTGFGNSLMAARDSDVTITGEGTKNNFGVLLNAGDVDGDGYSDLLAADVQANNSSGRGYLFYGTPSGFSSGDMKAKDAETMFEGSGSFFADGATIGDFNGDGFADVAIGAAMKGKTYVYLSPGAARFKRSVPSAQANTVISGDSSQTANWFGAFVSSGDVNGDGFSDLIVSAPGPAYIGKVNGKWIFLNNGLGQVFVYLSRGTSAFSSALNASNANSVLVGENIVDDFGWSIALGDVNGDSYFDILVGADTYKSCTALDQDILNPDCQGRAYLFLSSSSGLGASVAASKASTILDAKYDPSNFGFATSMVDVNGDGHQEVIVTGNGSEGVGKLYLYKGLASGLGASLIQNNAADLMIRGESEVSGRYSFGDSAR